MNQATNDKQDASDQQHPLVPSIVVEQVSHENGNVQDSHIAGTNDDDIVTVIPNSQDITFQHESAISKLTFERNKLEKDSNLSRRQLETMRRDNDALSRQVRDLRLRLSEGDAHLKQQVTTLVAEKRELESELIVRYKRGQMDGLRTQLAVSERVILVQQVEAYKDEAAKWKQEALGKGSDVLNTCWQASVDEAVRRKREEDNMVISALQGELAALKAEKRK
jgi:hypothetical protein